MIRFGLLILSTILTMLFLVQLIRGKKYDVALERLEGNEYTLSEIYGVGMEWQETIPALDYTGKMGQQIGGSIAMIYGNDYREYYTRITLAKAYTFAHFGCCASTLLGMILFSDATGLLIAAAGIAVSFFLAAEELRKPGNQVEEIADELTMELPNMVTKLALLVNSGVIMREAWFYVTEHTSGKLHEYLQVSCDQMENGYSAQDAIYSFGNASTSKEVKKLSSVLVQGMEKGNSELCSLLIQQSSELWATKRQKMLQKGEEAATKLLLPTMMMFVGLIIVIVTSSLGGMGL